MNSNEIMIAIKQTLQDIKENLKYKADMHVAKVDGSEKERSLLFSVKKENGRVKVYKITIKEL